MPSTPARRRLAALALLLALAAPLGAQALRVHATGDPDGRPLAGAVVELLGAADTAVARGILSSEGRRQLGAGAAGTYRVRLRRVGYEPFVSAPVAVGAADTLDVPLRVPGRRVTLEAVTVTGRRRCAGDARTDARIASLWEQVRTALTATQLAREDSAAWLTEARPFERTLDPDGRRLTLQVGLPRRAARPAQARPPAELSALGYVRIEEDGVWFFAPDERVLLSDEFVNEHCFQLVGAEEAAREPGHADAPPGAIALRFTPAPDRRRADIAGTLWVDAATAELRFLDFWYVDERLPRDAAGPGRSGGRIVLDRASGGRWVVAAWHLRRPRLKEGNLARGARPEGYHEVGGVATPPAPDSGTPAAAPQPALADYLQLLAPARLTGTVYDSLHGRPLAGARVWLVPAEEVGAAEGIAAASGDLAVRPIERFVDDAGRFALDTIAPGAWSFSFDHPTLDSLGVPLPKYTLRLAPGMEVVGDLTVPSLAALARGCARLTGAPDAGVLFGTVRSAQTGQLLVRALVRVSWSDLADVGVMRLGGRERVLETQTDRNGTYRVCGIPADAQATVQAAGDRSMTGQVAVVVREPGVLRQDLSLAEAGSATVAELPRSVLRGTVTDTAGAGLRDAVVLLDGTALETRTDSAGRFVLGGLPPGTQTVEVRHLGRAPARRTVELRPADTTRVALTLANTQQLEAVLVTGRSAAASKSVTAAIARNRMGMGQLLTQEEIMRRPDLRSLFRDLRGVDTEDDTFGWRVVLSAAGGGCVARVFVDGAEREPEVLQQLTPDEVRAVEVFVRPSQAPAYFVDNEARCGVVLVWTLRAP